MKTGDYNKSTKGKGMATNKVKNAWYSFFTSLISLMLLCVLETLHNCSEEGCLICLALTIGFALLALINVICLLAVISYTIKLEIERNRFEHYHKHLINHAKRLENAAFAGYNNNNLVTLGIRIQ